MERKQKWTRSPQRKLQKSKKIRSEGKRSRLAKSKRKTAVGVKSTAGEKSLLTKVKEIFSPKTKKRKNVSSTIPNGRTLQTRDEYFEGQGNYRKEGYQEKGNYRKAIVVDSNREGDLAVVKIVSSSKPIEGTQIKAKPFVETKDNKGNPIRIGKKFIPNSPKKDVPKSTINKLKKKIFREDNVSNKNRIKVREMKGRKQ